MTEGRRWLLAGVAGAALYALLAGGPEVLPWRISPDAAMAAADQPAETINQAVNSPDRPAKDKQLDPGRKPAETMAFLGIAPGMKVADLSAGGGYTTEILARIVGPAGKVYSQNAEFPPKFKQLGEAWQARLKEPALGNVVEVTKNFDADDLLPVEPGTLDAVVINLNYHDLVWKGVNRDKMNATVFKDLKPGGIYAIIDNSAKPGRGTADVKTLHRIDEESVKAEVEKAGFKLAGESDLQRHPDDPRTENWLKRGRLSVDHFILKFVKPT